MGFENVFDSDLVDYSGDFEKTEKPLYMEIELKQFYRDYINLIAVVMDLDKDAEESEEAKETYSKFLSWAHKFIDIAIGHLNDVKHAGKKIYAYIGGSIGARDIQHWKSNPDHADLIWLYIYHLMTLTDLPENELIYEQWMTRLRNYWSAVPDYKVFLRIEYKETVLQGACPSDVLRLTRSGFVPNMPNMQKKSALLNEFQQNWRDHINGIVDAWTKS